jgi:hypothetical protein
MLTTLYPGQGLGSNPPRLLAWGMGVAFSPAMTIRQQIVDAIEARFLGIRAGSSVALYRGGAHTYSTDAGARVFPSRATPLDPTAHLPCIAFTDTEASADYENSRLDELEHAISFEATALFLGRDGGAEARAAIGDLQAAIGADPFWGNLAEWTDITGHDIELDQSSGKSVSIATVRFTVRYLTALWGV